MSLVCTEVLQFPLFVQRKVQEGAIGLAARWSHCRMWAIIHRVCSEMEVTHSFVYRIWEKREREEKWGWEKCGWPFPAFSWWCAQRTEKRNFLDWTPLVFCWCRKDILFLMLRPIFWDQPGRSSWGTMSRGSKSKGESVRSSLLSQQENEKFEELLGRRCAVSFWAGQEGDCSSAINISCLNSL